MSKALTFGLHRFFAGVTIPLLVYDRVNYQMRNNETNLKTKLTAEAPKGTKSRQKQTLTWSVSDVEWKQCPNKVQRRSVDRDGSWIAQQLGLGILWHHHWGYDCKFKSAGTAFSWQLPGRGFNNFLFYQCLLSFRTVSKRTIFCNDYWNADGIYAILQ